MLNYSASYIMQMTNYKIMNEVNQFNFMIKTFEMIPDDKKQSWVNEIKIQIGNSFFDDLKSYLFKKVPDHQLLKLMK